MRILKYKYADTEKNGFIINEIELRNLNLLVGFSGSGKTRLLNTIMNFGRSAVLPTLTKIGHWDVDFSTNGRNYNWELKIVKNSNGESVVEVDNLFDIDNNKFIVERQNNKFMFNGSKLPKLKDTESSLSILRDESIIKPIQLSLTKILQRSFSHDSKDQTYLAYQHLDDNLQGIISKKKPVYEELLQAQVSLNIILYALKENDPKRFKMFGDFFMEIFPNIESLDILDIKYFNPDVHNLQTPIFCIKERGVEKWIEFHSLSSGMQKVIVIMSDILFVSKDWIYLIDEYENSLGPKIIDFLYDWIELTDYSQQYLITSHHPYVINNIPIKNWYVCSRKGSVIDFIYGEELVNIIGKSNQTAFSKLLSSPLFNREKQ